MSKRIKPPSSALQTKSGKISVPSTISLPDYKHPVFCFKFLQKNFHLNDCSNEQKIGLIEQLVKLSQIDWQILQISDRHGVGCEKISRKSIRAAFPAFITEDVNFLLAFRFHDMLPFLGHRDRFLFHIIFIDVNRDIYDHG